MDFSSMWKSKAVNPVESGVVASFGVEAVETLPAPKEATLVNGESSGNESSSSFSESRMSVASESGRGIAVLGVKNGNCSPF
jgi:hypothetical protein